MASTFVETLVEFECVAREADRFASAVADEMRGTVRDSLRAIDQSHKLIAEADAVLETDRNWGRAWNDGSGQCRT